MADRIIPGLLDRHLATRGYDSQQSDEPRPPDQPHDLWERLRGDHGAQGTFGERARAGSLQLELTMRRRWVAAGVVAILGAMALLLWWATRA